MSTAEKLRYTPEQYLALERESPVKNEYHDGCIYAIAGTSREHNLVAVNILREISSRFRDRPCEAYTSDMRVSVNTAGLYTYPDISAVCGEPAFLDGKRDTLLNPSVIVEVLSPSTEAYDRGAKFALYRQLASLREYVLVAQDRMLLERFTRQGDEWLLTEFRRPEDVLRLPSVDCEIPLREIYGKVQFPEATPEVVEERRRDGIHR